MKAAIEWTLAHAPCGHRLHFHLQQRFGELARLENLTRFDNACCLLQRTREHVNALESLHAVELGTGWVPAVPLSYLLAGVTLDTFDVSRLIHAKLFAGCMSQIDRRLADFAQAAGRHESILRDRFRLIHGETDFQQAAEKLGGSYRAPWDTTRLPYDDNQVDLVLSNLVLQCIPLEQLEDVLRESLRILKPGGLAIHRVRMTDEYACDDPHRNHLDYLRFSDKTWNRFFNHSIKHLNRLRHSQFLGLFDRLGFQVVACAKTVDWQSIRHLRKHGVAQEFRHLTWEDLATVAFEVTLLKPVGSPTDQRFESEEPLLAAGSTTA